MTVSYTHLGMGRVADGQGCPGAGAGSAAGHQLLHVPIHGLSHRRLQRQIRAGKEPGEVCAVRLLLPAAHSRPDRAL